MPKKFGPFSAKNLTRNASYGPDVFFTSNLRPRTDGGNQVEAFVVREARSQIVYSWLAAHLVLNFEVYHCFVMLCFVCAVGILLLLLLLLLRVMCLLGISLKPVFIEFLGNAIAHTHTHTHTHTAQNK